MENEKWKSGKLKGYSYEQIMKYVNEPGFERVKRIIEELIVNPVGSSQKDLDEIQRLNPSLYAKLERGANMTDRAAIDRLSAETRHSRRAKSMQRRR
jgi:hypothetical protein